MGFGRKMKRGAESIGGGIHNKHSLHIKKKAGIHCPPVRVASTRAGRVPDPVRQKRIYQTKPTDIPTPNPEEK